MKQKSILIFEDDLDLANQWSELFLAKGYKVNYTLSFKEALDLCIKTRYDLIICDIFIIKDNHLSGFGGISLIQHLRNGNLRLDWTKKVPIIMVSGATNAKERLEKHKEKYNVSFVFEKPVDPKQLLTVATGIIGPASKKD